MINLTEHVIRNIDLNIDTVPLSVAQKAVEEALEKFEGTATGMDEALKLIKDSVEDINNSIKDVLKDD
jgi:archaellum component FlaC|tara:strand:+ start:242 stop:445 length:204 start_codon:yes stop_codon:yes gene_type:complete